MHQCAQLGVRVATLPQEGFEEELTRMKAEQTLRASARSIGRLLVDQYRGA